MTVEQIYEWLTQELLTNDVHPFEEVGNRTLLHKGRDVVLVHVTDSNILIVHDGFGVVSNVTMLPILHNLDVEGIDSMYLQPILHRF